MNKKIFSLSCAILCSFIWGTAFVAQDMGMDFIGPYTFTSGRMFLGFFALLPFFFIFEFKKLKEKFEFRENKKILICKFDETLDLEEKRIYLVRHLPDALSFCLVSSICRILPPLFSLTICFSFTSSGLELSLVQKKNDESTSFQSNSGLTENRELSDINPWFNIVQASLRGKNGAILKLAQATQDQFSANLSFPLSQ